MSLSSLRQWAGLLRSLRMYYSTPRQAARLQSFYAPFVSAGEVCFDIGAHVGSRLRVFAALGARVVALEPQPLFYRFLKRVFGRRPGVVLLPLAAGAQAGQQTMLVSERAPTVSSLSPDWVAAVQARDVTFSDVAWNAELQIPVTTLDALIAEYGLPAFCKIDVEGYELEVLQGLSQPLPALSFEYIHTTLEVPFGCIQYLETLGRYQYNYTIIEAAEFALPAWVGPAEIIAALEQLPPHATSGDVYARLRDV